MWLAVMFDGIFGGDMVFGNNAGGGPTIIPSAVLLGLFAVIGTVSIAKRVFGRRDAGERFRNGSAIRAMRQPGGHVRPRWSGSVQSAVFRGDELAGEHGHRPGPVQSRPRAHHPAR